MEEYDVAVQCRSCLSTVSAEYIDMESSLAGGFSYLECFNICTNLNASRADELPVTICTVCSHDLQIAFEFVQVARQADAVLRENLLVQKEQILRANQDRDDMERLGYDDGEEVLVDTTTADEVADEHVLELQLSDKDEETDIKFDVEVEPEVQYIEMETLDEQMLHDAMQEQGYPDEKPEMDQLEEVYQQGLSDNQHNSIKEEKQEIPESYPEDEIDDEYLLEHNEAVADDETQQGWKCFECKRVMHADVSYEGHLNMHKSVKPYKCTQCRSTFRCRNALEHHTSKRHALDRTAQKCFTCDLCDKPFRLASLLLEHRRSEHKTLVNCTKCTKSFKSETLLEEHMALIHSPTNTTPVQCPYCSQPPFTKARLVEHLRLVHPADHRKHFHTVGRPCDENKVTPWQCEECFRYYRTEMLLKDHRNTHTNERPHTCNVCDKRFFTSNNLRCHMRSMHQSEHEKRVAESLESMVQCEICKKKLLQKNFEKHILTHERKEKQQSSGEATAKYLCAYCPKSFINQAKLSKHEEVHNPDRTRSHSCEFCESKFYSQYDKIYHVRRVHQSNERAFVCSICGNAFKEKAQLRNHAMLHTQKNIQCTLCDKKYARQTDFLVHMRSHTGELPFTCHLCDKSFAIKVRLTYHLQKHLGVKHECKICGASYNSRGKLRMHLFKHNGMPYRCEECPEAQFSKRERFRLHITRVHNRPPSEEELTANFERNTGKTIPQEFLTPKKLTLHEEGTHLLKQQEPKHNCKQCTKKFFQHKHLQAHISRVHTQFRKYACEICGNAFKGRSQLSAHMKLHMEKSLNCPHCEKKYARSADLTVHMRTHTGERPFACHLCPKRFAIKVRLTYHLQRHEGLKHPCPHCEATYDNRNKLKEHMFKHTGMPYRCEECPGVEFSRRLRFTNHMLRTHDRCMTDDELAQMFAKNTGKVIRFKQLEVFAIEDCSEEEIMS